MRETIIAVLAALVAWGPACSSETEDTESFDKRAADWTRPPPNPVVRRAVEKEWQRLRSIEGREGILAEERLYSTFDEELIIRDFFQDRTSGFFLDVGCAWPVRQSNTYYLEKHLGWTGIGIDALSEYGSAWKEKRSNSRFFSYLVTDRSGVGETFYRSPTTGLSSTSRELASGKLFGAELETEEMQVEAITLDDLLDREGVTKIDLLAMDIEGHEQKALTGFDIDRFQPELAVIEGPMLSPIDVKDWVYLYFERHGYELLEKYRPFDNVNRYFKRKARLRLVPKSGVRGQVVRSVTVVVAAPAFLDTTTVIAARPAFAGA